MGVVRLGTQGSLLESWSSEVRRPSLFSSSTASSVFLTDTAGGLTGSSLSSLLLFYSSPNPFVFVVLSGSSEPPTFPPLSPIDTSSSSTSLLRIPDLKGKTLHRWREVDLPVC